jgi:multisubunit Na+/H+ antiporter MnhC subunit
VQEKEKLMKRIITVLAVALVLAAMVVVMAMPAFAAITTTQTNGGGNTPHGNANGVPTVSSNPAGHQPPGQNQ